jgi:hypothetical protein
MHSVAIRALAVAATATIASLALVACGNDSTSPGDPGALASCTAIDFGPKPATLTLPQASPAALATLGNGLDTVRYQAEVAVRGTTAYTTSWSVRQAAGNKVSIWDVSGNVPIFVDSLIIPGASTTGDVAVSDDGKLLVVATERVPGSIVIYDLTNPRKPTLESKFTNAETNPGVHTAEIGRVNGRLYGFLAIDPLGTTPARLVTVDLSNPAAPAEVYTKVIGNPYVHDTFARDGLLFLALWNDGVQIWDIGGCGTGATPEAPKVLGSVKTLNGQVHNIWWYHDPAGSKRYAFVGEEGPGIVPTQSSGDIHVIDLTDLAQPKEVAYYTVAGAGTHNFSVDETNGVLYAAYYNGGVRALDIRGDLGTCDASQKNVNVSANLSRCDLRLMGRELAIGLQDQAKPVYIWGVQYLDGYVYASDMVNGIWKLKAAK